MASDFHNFMVQVAAERVEPNKLLKLKKEFDGVLQCLSPMKKYAPRIYIGGIHERRIEINTYSDMDIQIFFPVDLRDHIREVNEYAYELVAKKFDTRTLGIIYRVSLSEDYDIDIVCGKAEDYNYEYGLLYDPETNERQTGKLNDQVHTNRNARILVKLVKQWKRHKLLNWDSLKLEKSELPYFLKKKNLLKDYGEAFYNWLLDTMAVKKKTMNQYETQRFIAAGEETLKAIKEKFWIRTIY